MGQEPHGRIEIGGLGTYLTGAIQAGPLVVASATFPALRLAVIPRARPNFDVVLGSDVLAGLRIVFAGGGHRARIEPATGDLDGTAVGLEFAAGLPFVEVRLGGREAAGIRRLSTRAIATWSRSATTNIREIADL